MVTRSLRRGSRLASRMWRRFPKSNPWKWQREYKNDESILQNGNSSVLPSFTADADAHGRERRRLGHHLAVDDDHQHSAERSWLGPEWDPVDQYHRQKFRAASRVAAHPNQPSPGWGIAGKSAICHLG